MKIKVHSGSLNFVGFANGVVEFDFDCDAGDIIGENGDEIFLEEIGKERCLEYFGIEEAE